MSWFESNQRRTGNRPIIALISGGCLLAPIASSSEFVCGVNHVDGLAVHSLGAESGTAGKVPDAPLASSLGRKRLLLIRVDFEDLPGDPLSEASASNLITSLEDYFHRASYGRFELASAGAMDGFSSGVTPTLRMPHAAAYYGTNQLFQLLRADALTAAAQAGWAADEFDFDIVCLGRAPGFTWTGLGNIGARGAWLRGQFTAGIAAHELGHNLGLRHANLWDTAGQSVIGAGVEVEYGDSFDTMGTGGAAGEFNVRYKEWLGWIQAGEFHEAMSNGVYRIHAHDSGIDSGKARAMVVRGQGGTNYWFEHRQNLISQPWSRQGAQMRWGFGGNQSTLLLDTTPGSAGGRVDAPLLVGKTFSDSVLGLHVTVLGQNETAPASVDLMVQRGAFPANRNPIVLLTAVATNAFVGQKLLWTATALDPDGDALAYHWDFGDGTFGGNISWAEHGWVVPGEYVVRCEVSDMKGGRASDAVIVRIGAPATFRISGTIRTARGDPVEGVRVSASAGAMAFTVSSGRYDLVGLREGEYRLQAVRHGFRVFPETFANPVRVGPNVAGADFLAELGPSQLRAPMVPAGSVWRFLDDGSDQGTAWREPDFVDRSWELGPAEMGYGDGDEATLVDFGAFSNNKHITTYFRHAFDVADTSRIGKLYLGLLRDDGAVVFLNGCEVYRSNMPAGRYDFQTRALSTVGSTAERAYHEIEIPPLYLENGENVLAVEVHQQDRDSSDLSFDMFLHAVDVSHLPPGANLEHPREGDTFRTTDRIVLFANASTGTDESVERVDFYAGGVKLGHSTERPFIFTWEQPPLGIHPLSARARGQFGASLTSGPVTIVVGWELVASESRWRYYDLGSDLGQDWKHPEFDDLHWPSGRAELGYGDGDESTVVGYGPNASDKFITTYFRHEFHVEEKTVYTNLTFRLLRDDGAVVWLNGIEQWRSNMPVMGVVDHSTRAEEGIGDEEEWVYHEAVRGPEDLRNGRNVAAVEVHQRSPSSSDISFDLEILGTGPGQGVAPRLTIIRSGQDVRIQWWEQERDWTLMAGNDPAGPWRQWPDIPSIGDGVMFVESKLSDRNLYFRLQEGAAAIFTQQAK